MTRFAATRLIAAGLLIVSSGAATQGGAWAQTAATGQFGQRVGDSYLPSTHDAGCVGLLCSPLPANPANPAEAVAPPPCQGLLCSVTPYSMQRPYTASEAAEVERQRAAAQQAQAAAPGEMAAPVRHARKRRRVAKVAKSAAKAAAKPAARPAAIKAATRTPAPTEAPRPPAAPPAPAADDGVQSLR